MKHVMIIGQRTADAIGLQVLGDQDFRTVLGWLAAAEPDPDFAYGTCSSPDKLAETVRGLVTERSQRDASWALVDRLDIYYHGREGRIWLGPRREEDVLFASDASLSDLTGCETAAALRPLLSDTAEVRLLGCLTGAGTSGRMLLLKLARHLGASRVVFAPIVDLVPEHFSYNTGRFTTPEYLFSSLGALDREPPSKEERDFETPVYKPSMEC